MKQFLPLASLLAVATVAFGASHEPVNPALLQVKKVYLLPMGSGLDQFLASHLTQLGVFDVVTDPKKADAVFTERLGAAFERRMDDFYAPKPPAPPPEAKDKNSDKEPSAADKAEADRLSANSTAVQMPTFGRNRGTLFLVDRNTRSVIWSTYEHPKDTRPKTLDSTGQRIARKLQTDLNPQRKTESR
ncbi:MAG TPA: hypothetical protein VHD76_13730 [Bryobacteraceae bacterium]|jgi:hypothetical protein|nr:hypothetical protein [Bryobacteraceae bacterium]